MASMRVTPHWRCAMPSPFPGMDPYLEHPKLWLDFHNELASAIRAALNGSLEPRYRARLTSYVAYETIEVAQSRRVESDVGVWEVQRRHDEGPVALEHPRRRKDDACGGTLCDLVA